MSPSKSDSAVLDWTLRRMYTARTKMLSMWIIQSLGGTYLNNKIPTNLVRD